MHSRCRVRRAGVRRLRFTSDPERRRPAGSKGELKERDKFGRQSDGHGPSGRRTNAVVVVGSGTYGAVRFAGRRPCQIERRRPPTTQRRPETSKPQPILPIMLLPSRGPLGALPCRPCPESPHMREDGEANGRLDWIGLGLDGGRCSVNRTAQGMHPCATQAVRNVCTSRSHNAKPSLAAAERSATPDMLGVATTGARRACTSSSLSSRRISTALRGSCPWTGSRHAKVGRRCWSRRGCRGRVAEARTMLSSLGQRGTPSRSCCTIDTSISYILY